jgi:cell division protein FtsL
MNKREYLLTKFIEECLETAQRATKILTFGADEVQPGQAFNNTERLNHEWNDLQATQELLAEEAEIELYRDVSLIIRKREKVEKFMEYSRQQGCLTDEG